MEDNIKILLIEDSSGDARLISIYLKNEYGDNHSLTTTTLLAQGIDLLKENIYDIIILDLSLPDSSGIDTFNKIHASVSETPIIVLTGLEDESIGINAMKHGAQDFLVKGNVGGKELKRCINYSIERFRLVKELSKSTKELKERTKELLIEQQKLFEAQKLAHIGSWEWDIIEDKIIWSEELYRIYNLNSKEISITSQKICEMIHPEDKEHVKKIIKEAKAIHHPFSFYYRIVLSDKSVRTLQCRAEIVINETGEAIKIIGTDQDVTDRMYEEELEKLVLAATQSYNSVIILDKTGKIEWVNEGFTKLTGYTLDDLKNTEGEILRKNDQDGIIQQHNMFDSILKNKKPFTYENKNFTKEGIVYWTITTATPILDKNGEIQRVIAIDSDITIRKQIEEELVQANKIAEHSLMKGSKAFNELIKAKKQLEELMIVKEQFLANMSHEIRTPMNAIVGFTDIIIKTELTTEQRQYIDSIKIAGQNLLVIINDILDFSKIQSGKFSFEQIELHLSQVISTLIELMLPKSIEKGIRLSTKIDPAIPDQLIGDPTRLNQILLNLLGNAIKFTEKGEIKIIVDLVSEKDKIIELKFSIIDTGIGISENKLSTIFDGFTQASNETTRKYGGTGLGLTIVKQLIELQGGSISVQSKIGVGSTFTFILKFKKSNKTEREKNNTSREIEKTESLVGLNILLVEDNLLNQILAKKVLTDWKWNVEVANNGVIALEKVEKNNYDLILMDIQLPEMDGYEATRIIRKKFDSPKRNIPIIAMTAHALSGEAEKCINAGMNEYISKPFDSKVLYSKIISVIKNNINTIQNGKK